MCSAISRTCLNNSGHFFEALSPISAEALRGINTMNKNIKKEAVD